MEQGHERAASGKPDRGLARGVAAAHDRDARGAALLRLGRAGRVERAHAFVLVQLVQRKSAVRGSRRQHDGPCGDLVLLFQPDDVPAVAGLEPDGAEGRRGARAELARLGDGPAGELGAADAGREAEVVLDPARGAGLAAQRRALDDQRVEALGGSVDRGGQARRAGADDEQVDLLTWRELAAHSERAQQLAPRRMLELDATGEPNERRLRSGWCLRVLPAERQPVGTDEIQHRHRRLGRARPDDLESEALDALKRLAAGDEGRQDEVAERPVVEQHVAQRVALDSDVTEGLGHERGHEDGLAREEIQLAEKARGAVADELVAGGIEDRHLAFLDGDERIGGIADPVQHVADACRPLLAQRRERRHLRSRKRWDGGDCHRPRVATRVESVSSGRGLSRQSSRGPDRVPP